jgi:hypothetical protein
MSEDLNSQLGNISVSDSRVLAQTQAPQTQAPQAPAEEASQAPAAVPPPLLSPPPSRQKIKNKNKNKQKSFKSRNKEITRYNKYNYKETRPPHTKVGLVEKYNGALNPLNPLKGVG